MEKLNHPERELSALHIGGTNGKGSTVTFLRSMLQAGGYKVGTFTSPYIEQFNERISVNGTPIPDEQILELANVIKPLSDELEETELGGPTEFEVITAMAFYYFARIEKTDFVLFEVGLGGRFDSTNIIRPLLSIITNIGLDHTQILGDSYEAIAFEKAGIIKEGIPIVTAVKNAEALKVIEEQAILKNAPILRIEKEYFIKEQHSLEHGESFSIHSILTNLDDITISMVGKHQTENAAAAVMALQCLIKEHSLSINEDDLRLGLKQAFWPGRFEKVSDQPLVYLDGAHNEEGINALVEILTNRFSEKEIHIVFAALKDKKLDEMIHKLDKVASNITFVSFDFPRAAVAKDLFDISRSNNKSRWEDWSSQLETKMDVLQNNQMLVITGSLYFISEIKGWICQKMKE
ncbi:dihydrofolate synthase / folylpolyglutamate synthase [Bacillus sp. UNCCL13]|nr:dihydrofolate synthase / folylpolyglutamate synthase [Bacillus sp. UNCCL13]